MGFRIDQLGHDTANASITNPSVQYMNYSHSVTVQDREGAMFHNSDYPLSPSSERPTNRVKYLTQGKLLLKFQDVLRLKKKGALPCT
jgi:hypothetical protein